MTIKTLAIDLLRTDGDTQSRKSINKETVADYAEVWESAEKSNGNPFSEKIVVFHDGSDYWLASGFHRIMGAVAAKRSSVSVDVRKGTNRDAFLFGLKANAEHGLRRTNEDKRFAVERMLTDKEWKKRSQRWIADEACVSAKLVREMKAELDPAAPPVEQGSVPSLNRGGSKVIGRNGREYAAKDPSKASTKPATETTTTSGTDSITDDDGGEPETYEGEPCPNCRSTSYSAGDCSNCGHPEGEPMGEPSDAWKDLRSKAIKTAQALLRAVDDFHAVKPLTGHGEKIDQIKAIILDLNGVK